MLPRTLACTLVSILILAPVHPLLAGTANASTVVFSTFGPGDAYDTSSGWVIGDSGVYVQGLQFIPTTSGVLQTIEIAAFRLSGGTALSLALMSDAADLPDAVIETLPICCFGADASIQMASSVLHPLLTGGAKYWLVVSPVGVGDNFGWSRNLTLPPSLNVQKHGGGPWYAGRDWTGTIRIRSDEATPTRGTTWGRLKSLYR